jgi:metallo-beta-lactamase family protein
VSLKLRFCGAARTVTESCHFFEAENSRILVDCGLFQGSKTLKALNYGAFPFHAGDIDAVLLTHAHIDHSGLLPKLVRNGFRGRIFATQGTIDLCSFMLPDSGSIQESEVVTLNRRNAARGRAEVTPIYTQADAAAALQRELWSYGRMIAGDLRTYQYLLQELQKWYTN